MNTNFPSFIPQLPINFDENGVNILSGEAEQAYYSAVNQAHLVQAFCPTIAPEADPNQQQLKYRPLNTVPMPLYVAPINFQNYFPPQPPAFYPSANSVEIDEKEVYETEEPQPQVDIPSENVVNEVQDQPEHEALNEVPDQPDQSLFDIISTAILSSLDSDSEPAKVAKTANAIIPQIAKEKPVEPKPIQPPKPPLHAGMPTYVSIKYDHKKETETEEFENPRRKEQIVVKILKRNAPPVQNVKTENSKTKEQPAMSPYLQAREAALTAEKEIQAQFNALFQAYCSIKPYTSQTEKAGFKKLAEEFRKKKTEEFSLPFDIMVELALDENSMQHKDLNKWIAEIGKLITAVTTGMDKRIKARFPLDQLMQLHADLSFYQGELELAKSLYQGTNDLENAAMVDFELGNYQEITSARTKYPSYSSTADLLLKPYDKSFKIKELARHTKQENAFKAYLKALEYAHAKLYIKAEEYSDFSLMRKYPMPGAFILKAKILVHQEQQPHAILKVFDPIKKRKGNHIRLLDLLKTQLMAENALSESLDKEIESEKVKCSASQT